MTADITNFATQAGTTVVGSLTATAAQFNSLRVEGLITYGLIDYTFSGSPDFSAVLQGHTLTVTGFTNANNNGSGMAIHAVNNTTKVLTVKMVERTSSSEDETGASATGTVVTSGAQIKELSVAKNAQGFVTAEKVSSGHLNWILSEQNALITLNTIRGGYARVDTNTLTSTTFADLDSALENFGYYYFTPGVSWSASANDGAYESVAVGFTMTSDSNSQTILLLTGNSPDNSVGPFDPRIKVDGTTIVTFITAPFAAIETYTQATNCFGFAKLTDQTGFFSLTTEAKRRTGGSASTLRLHAIDVPDLDQTSTALIRATSTLTETSFTSSTYADITGATATATFTHSNALVLYGASFKHSTETTGQQVYRMYKLLRDATTIFSTDTAAYMLSTADRGYFDTFARIVPVTGAHTIKMQANRPSGTGTTKIAADGNGYFTVIELPDTWDGDTLVRSSTAVDGANYTNGTYATRGTLSSIACNGHPLLLCLSGHLYAANNGASVCTVDIKFQVDAGDVGDAFSFKVENTSNYSSGRHLFVLVDGLAAGSHDFTVQVKSNGGFGYNMYDCTFMAIEFPQVEAPSTTPAAIDLTSTTGKKVQISHRGTVTPTANSTLTLRATADGSAVGNEEEYSLTAGTATKIDFMTVADAEAAGSDVTYKIQAKISTGRASIPASDFITQEMPGT